MGYDPIMIAQFLAQIERFLERYQVTPSVFGEQSINDSGFVFDLRRGRSPRLNTVERVQKWMAAEESRRAALKKRKRRNVQSQQPDVAA